MSRWKILQDAITHKKRTVNESSIHRFHGHESFCKRKCLWEGFSLHIQLAEVTQVDGSLFARCESFIKDVDCPQVFLVIHTDVADQINETSVMERLSVVQSAIRFEFLTESPGTCAKKELCFRVTCPNYVPVERNCQFSSYSLLPFEDLNVFTREPIENKTVSLEELCSNRLYGVDNTGNICVWPSEPLFLYILLENEGLKELVKDRTILEIGSGLTGKRSFAVVF
jgi:hypothetical protein